MPVFANEMTQEVIIREFPYAFTDFRYPGVPEIQLNTIAIGSIYDRRYPGNTHPGMAP